MEEMERRRGQRKDGRRRREEEREVRPVGSPLFTPASVNKEFARPGAAKM